MTARQGYCSSRLDVFKGFILISCLLMSVSGCGVPEASEESDGNLCNEYDSDWCFSQSNSQGAYFVGHGVLYCYAEQVHEGVDDGDFSYRAFMESSPEWVSSEEVHGRPVIADIPNIAARDTGRYADDIADVLSALGSSYDNDAREMCMAGMSQQVLEEKFGPLKAE